jgi:hypothetical protein
MVERAAPASTMTEAFAWLATAMAVGAAGGAAGAGVVADRGGPSAAFALAGGAGALAVLATLLQARTLSPPPHAAEAVHSKWSSNGDSTSEQAAKLHASAGMPGPPLEAGEVEPCRAVPASLVEADRIGVSR